MRQVSDGNLLHHNGVFYLYGVRYQPCPVSQQADCYNPCGYYNNSFVVYYSKTLAQDSWRLGSASLLPAMDVPGGPLSSQTTVYFSPFVVFCAATQRFVMWFQYAFKQRAVAVSHSPFGPFTVSRFPNATGLPPFLVNGSSVYLWVDDIGSDSGAGGTAYMLINLILRGSERGASQWIGRLASDYETVVDVAPVEWSCTPPAQSDPVGSNSVCFQEGGGLFKDAATRTWFVLGGNGCCFCAGGSDSKVWRSLAGAMGPYVEIGWLNAPARRDYLYNYTIAAQQFGVHAVRLASGQVQPMYIGQRWGSGATKRTDLQYWAPIEVLDGGQTLRELQWQGEFELDV